jgi:hypothetical protein
MITLTTGMLDGDPLAELGPSVGGELALAEFDQQPLVGMDGDAAAGGRGGTARPQRAGRAGLGGEADRAAELERHHDPVGTGQLATVEVQREGGLGEPWSRAWPVADLPGLAVDRQVVVAVADQVAGKIGPPSTPAPASAATTGTSVSSRPC